MNKSGAWSDDAKFQMGENAKRRMSDGAQRRNRTADTGIFNPLLYLLSYLDVWKDFVVPRDGIEPPTRGFSIPCSTY